MRHRNTQAYLKLREQIQSSFDFVYIVSQAVPCMKLQTSLVKKGIINELPIPDYFTKPNPLEQIELQVKGYKTELSRYILLSSFSYFESFVVDIIEELIKFHGDSDIFESRARRITERAIRQQDKNHIKERISLSKTDPKNQLKRHSATQKLINNHFIFPSTLLSHLGVKALVQKLANIKSVDIPKLMIDGFCMDWSEEEISNFHRMRNIRNDVAHGKTVNLNVKDVIQMNTQMRDLAKNIDQHLLKHFFISQEYV